MALADLAEPLRFLCLLLLVSFDLLVVRESRQKATKGTKNRKTGALASLKNSVMRPPVTR